MADRWSLSTGHADGRVRLHDARGRLRACAFGPHAAGGATVCAADANDGRVAVTGGADGVVAVWVCDHAALASVGRVASKAVGSGL